MSLTITLSNGFGSWQSVSSGWLRNLECSRVKRQWIKLDSSQAKAPHLALSPRFSAQSWVRSCFSWWLLVFRRSRDMDVLSNCWLKHIQDRCGTGFSLSLLDLIRSCVQANSRYTIVSWQRSLMDMFYFLPYRLHCTRIDRQLCGYAVAQDTAQELWPDSWRRPACSFEIYQGNRIIMMKKKTKQISYKNVYCCREGRCSRLIIFCKYAFLWAFKLRRTEFPSALLN